MTNKSVNQKGGRTDRRTDKVDVRIALQRVCFLKMAVLRWVGGAGSAVANSPEIREYSTPDSV